MSPKDIDINQLKKYLFIHNKGLKFEDICSLFSIEYTQKNRIIFKSLIKFENEIVMDYKRENNRVTTLYTYKKNSI